MRERSRAIPYALSLSALSSFFFETGRRQGWIGGTKPIVLAVSGGSDSMALLWLFRTFCERPLVVAHLEHGMRGETALDDARYVERMAAGWGIESVVLHADVPGTLQKGESVESGGRRMRYAFLTSEAEKRGAFGVALAHNREDVAETVLFNLLRGTGVRGAVGIPECRGIFFRPLLACSREFLRSILRCRNIEWREDCTNEDNRFTRNFIRNELMPLIVDRVNERAVDHLVAFGEEMRYYREEEERRAAILHEAVADSDVPDVNASDLYALDLDISPTSGIGCALDRRKARGLSPHERTLVIREIGRRLGLPTLSRRRGVELARLMEGGERFEFQWIPGVSVWGDRERVSWSCAQKTKRDE
ncbi:MAG: tRNA lysidine(34) synthetase TilS [Synergistaceae bacterium]|nr:tRNA lysidine(34) synthetase TilS [Synergistaceae bacterium]